MELRIIDKWARVGQCDACREQRAVYRVELRRPCGNWLGQVCRYCGSGMRLYHYLRDIDVLPGDRMQHTVTAVDDIEMIYEQWPIEADKRD